MVAGISNLAAGHYSNIGGGYANTANGYGSTVGGGHLNTCGNAGDGDAAYAFVGGGWGNLATGHFSSVPGGLSNIATGYGASVVGGVGNTAAGSFAVAAGTNSIASGIASVAIGENASATSDRSAVLNFGTQPCADAGTGTVAVCVDGGFFINGMDVMTGQMMTDAANGASAAAAGSSGLDSVDLAALQATVEQLQSTVTMLWIVLAITLAGLIVVIVYEYLVKRCCCRDKFVTGQRPASSPRSHRAYAPSRPVTTVTAMTDFSATSPDDIDIN